MSFSLHEVPGYAEALAAAKENEFTTREDAWWNLTFDLGGVRLRTMTVQDYEVLLRRRSPLLLRQMPLEKEMLLFLWLLSPENEEWERATGRFANWRRERVRRRHERKCRKLLDLESLTWLVKTHDLEHPGETFIVPDDHPYAVMFGHCVRYIDRMFFDKPAGLANKGAGSGMSYLTSWFCTLQREFHLPTAEIEKMPLPELFARVREVQATRNPTMPDFNKRVDALNKQVMDALRGGMQIEDLMAGKLKFNLN